MRVAAGILRRQKVKSKVMFTGCISDDDFGQKMAKKAQEDGVITCYAIANSEPTGTCAVLLTDQGKNRSLCAFLGASQRFNEKYLLDNWQELVENTDVIYLSGFLLAVCPPSYHLLGEHVAKSSDPKKRCCLNLSAPYVSLVFGKELEKVMKYVDIVFGNDDEAIAYAEFKGWGTKDVQEIATKMCTDEKVRNQIGRMVIITQGDRPIILVQKLDDGTLDTRQYTCKAIESKDMVDTNGAGDSFAGGFLSQFIQGAPLDFCIEMGSYAAREIIKVSGTAVPDFADIPKRS